MLQNRVSRCIIRCTPYCNGLSVMTQAIAYLRVSTEDQHIANQREAIKAAGFDIVREFTDVATSGTVKAESRDGFAAMLAYLLLVLLASNIATMYLAYGAREAADDAASSAQSATDAAEEVKSSISDLEDSLHNVDRRVRSIQDKVGAF